MAEFVRSPHIILYDHVHNCTSYLLCFSTGQMTGATKNCWRIRFQKLYVSYSTGIQCSVAQHNQGKNRQSIWWGKVQTSFWFDVGGLVSDMLLLSTVFIKTFTQNNLKPHEFIRKPWIKFHAWRLAPCIVHKCGKTSIDTSNRVLDRKKYRLTG